MVSRSGVSTTDKIRIWKITLAEYVFMAGLMFIINAKDGACQIYYTRNLQFDLVSRGLFSAFGLDS